MTKGSGHMLFIADTTRERMQQAAPSEPDRSSASSRSAARVEPVPVWTLAPVHRPAARAGAASAGAASAGPLAPEAAEPA